MAGVQPTIAVEVELAGVGGGWTDLRAGGDVATQGSLVIAIGIHGSSPLDLVASTGTATFTLDNSASNSGAVVGYYSPHHASARSGWDIGIGCRVRLQDPDTLTWHTRFLGRVDAIDPVPGLRRERVVHVTAVDWIDEAARWKLVPEIGEQVNKSWDAILNAILAEMPLQPSATSFDAGTENYPYALDTSVNARQPALSEFKKLASSEFGLIFQKANGTLRAENRHGRMTSTASVWTLTDGQFQNLEIPSDRDDIINTVRITTHPRRVDDEPTTIVYDQANVIQFATSETKILMGSYRDPVTGDSIGATDWQALASGTDYIANTAANGTGTDVTSSFSITVARGPSGMRFTVTNNSGGIAYLTTLELRAKGVYDRSTVQHEATDTTSITAYGEHVAEFDMPYQANQQVGQGAADFTLDRLKDPLAQVRSISVRGKTTALLTQILTRDISDRITLSETVTGVSGDFYINGIEMTVEPAGYVSATYILTPAQDVGNYFELDASALDGADILAPF